MTAKRKCKQCGVSGYEHIRTNAGSFCNFDHAIKWSIEKTAKDKLRAQKKAKAAENKKHAQKKREFYDNDKPLRVSEAQKAFNGYVRGRDKGLACISCGNMPNFNAYVGGSGIQAGHYLSVGANPELRFEPLNCHVQCVNCNMHNSGNIAGYRIGLVKKIGVEKVEWLEGPHEAKKYICQDLKEIELHFKQKLKELVTGIN